MRLQEGRGGRGKAEPSDSLPPARVRGPGSPRRCPPSPAATDASAREVRARRQLGGTPPPAPPPAQTAPPAGTQAGGHTPHAPRRPLHCPARLAARLSPAGSPWSAACSSRPWSRPPPHSVRSPRVDTAGPPLPVLPPEAATEQLPGPPLAPPAAVLQPSHVCSASRRGLDYLPLHLTIRATSP